MSSEAAATLSRRGCPIIVLDGREGLEGRATFTISALYHCMEWLRKVSLRVADVSNEDVVTAIDVFRFESRINIDIRHPNDRSSPLRGADLYVATAFRSAGYLRLSEARSAGIPVMLAIQFPDAEWAFPSVLLRQDAAFDPRVFATDLGAIVKPWL